MAFGQLGQSCFLKVVLGPQVLKQRPLAQVISFIVILLKTHSPFNQVLAMI